MDSRTKNFAAAVAFMIAITTAGSAVAEDDDKILPGEFSGNVALSSDYTFRGVSQTDEDPALSGGIDWSHDSGIFVGLWGSTINFSEDSYLEQDIYGGYAGEVGAFSYDVGAYFFWYPNEEEANYWEFALNGGYDFGMASVSAGYLYSPDYFGFADDGHYLSTGVAVPIPVMDGLDVSIDGNVGYTKTDDTLFVVTDDSDVVTYDTDDYTDWNIGLTVGFPSGIGIDLRYVDTDLDSDIDIADARFVAALSYAF